jgi:(R)-2-hydroxyacyl-CoA dehydratese activating ATPase
LNLVAGLDSGSTTTKLVLLKDGKIADYRVIPTGANSQKSAERVLRETLNGAGFRWEDIQSLVATGYGRSQVGQARAAITEISCHARGAHWLFPAAEAVIDIGGQDLKGIRLNADGRVTDFQMNDKCAAGTGRFLEVMARNLEMNLGEFARAALEATEAVAITNICTVFAESEVVSHVARGTPVGEIAAGVHEAVSRRVTSMLSAMLNGVEAIVFTGGVAKNTAMVKVLEKRMEKVLLIPAEPQIVGAIGAALFASDGL